MLVANGDQDKMVPSSNSVDLARRLPNADLVLYDDAGYGSIFQYHEAFVKKAWSSWSLKETRTKEGPTYEGQAAKRSGQSASD